MTGAEMSQQTSAPSSRRARELYRDLIDFYRRETQPSRAAECVEMAIRHGLWHDPAQRPIDYQPGLLARPVHDASLFPVCSFLEAGFATIRKDLAVLQDQGCAGFFPVEEPLLNSGNWEEAIFYEGGRRYDRAAEHFPNIASVVDQLPEDVRQCGVVMLSRLAPGTHIVPHCGFTNRRLRIHLGLLTPPDALMRVSDQFVEWQQGKCVVFDDSFEHEVWHFGASQRIVLLLDIPHPDASEAVFDGHTRQLAAGAESFMRERGLYRIDRADKDGRLAVEFDDYHARLVRRLMDEMKVESVVLDSRKD